MARASRPSGTRGSPKPTLVLCVRHGRTATTGSVLPGRAPGLHLSPEGRTQAEHVAGRIATLPRIDAVYASPLERTRETAAPIARTTGHRVRTAKGLLECDFGEWTGRRLADLRKLPEWNAVQHSPSTFRFPEGESFTEMQNRIWNQLLALAAAHPGGTVVATSHADPIKAAVAMAAGIHLDLFQRTSISPCSITALLVGSGTPLVLCTNSVGDDLSGLSPS
ncbi:MAG: phosphoglycerate mutase [Actinobacteria bacterium]|nr:phosphoglycerate mutase [Actinomycetota bacterium]